jgi:hypothetical protein
VGNGDETDLSISMMSEDYSFESVHGFSFQDTSQRSPSANNTSGGR